MMMMMMMMLKIEEETWTSALREQDVYSVGPRFSHAGQPWPVARFVHGSTKL